MQNSLVGVFLDDMRPLPTELLFLCLQFAGLVQVGRTSVHFYIKVPQRRFSGARRLASQSRRPARSLP